MAFEIVWTRRAISGYDRIINYLAENWSDKEVMSFITETDRFFDVLKTHPEIMQKTFRHKNVYRGPINKLTVITYRKNQIELIKYQRYTSKAIGLELPALSKRSHTYCAIIIFETFFHRACRQYIGIFFQLTRQD